MLFETWGSHIWQESEGHPQNSAEDAESIHILQEVKPAEVINSLNDIIVFFATQMLIITFIKSEFIVFEVYCMRHFKGFRLLACFGRKWSLVKLC